MKKSKRGERIFFGAAAAAMMMLAGTGVHAEEESLNLYLSTWEQEYFQSAITAFQQQYPEVELSIETWDPYASSLFGEAEKLASRLMAGEGPDLLVSENFPTQDLRKLMKAGVYAPLDEFMAQEDIWNDENYVMSVIDGGKFNGIQYVMPMSYSPLLVVSSKEAMEEAGLTASECPDTLSLLKALAALSDAGVQDRVLASYAQLGAFPLCLDGDFLNYETGEIGTDPQILREACEAYAKLYEEDTALVDGGGDYAGYGEAIVERRAYCTATSYTGTIASSLEVAGAIAASETPAVIPFRNAQGEAVVNVRAYAGIRANSTNRQNAWNMLRLMLAEEAQRTYSLSRDSYSVVRPVLEETVRGYSDRAPALDSGFMEEFLDMVSKPQKCVFVTDVVTAEFKKAMEPFYYGEEDYEECAEEFKKFAQIYLTE